MAIARIDEFIAQLQPLTRVKDIQILCRLELDYLRQELGITTQFSPQGYPVGVLGDARRLKTQVSAYRNAIKLLPTNSRNSVSKIRNGEPVRVHKALRYFNLEYYEKQDVSQRDRQRVRLDKTNRPSFDAVAVIERSLKLLDSNSYVSKVAGLYLLTGRRHQEILVTGNFDSPFFEPHHEALLDQWLFHYVDCTLFSGQVKRKSHQDRPYIIPLLTSWEVVRDTIQWLRVHKPHSPGQRAKGSKELGAKVRKEFQAPGLLPIPSGKDSFLNPHNLRSAYAAICWQLYRHSHLSSNCTEDLFIKAIMGHLEDTTDSAQSYLDYEITNRHLAQLLDYAHH